MAYQALQRHTTRNSFFAHDIDLDIINKTKEILTNLTLRNEFTQLIHQRAIAQHEQLK